MNSNTPTPTTSPSSDGDEVTSYTIASLSPKDLTDEYEQVETKTEPSPRSGSPSTTSVHPNDAFSVPATNTATPEGDNSNQHIRERIHVNQHNHHMLEAMMGLRMAEDDETKLKLYRMMVGCMFAYIVLGIWIWTVVHFVILINIYGCNSAFVALTANLLANPGSGFPDNDAHLTMACLEKFTGTFSCAHSITFGLISAVVIREMGSSDASAQNRLSSIVQPIKKRQDVNANFIQRSFCSLITSLPMLYIACWTVVGLTCFVFSLVRPDGSTGPLFYTGK